MMGMQPIEEEMQRLQIVAQAADDRREVLRGVQLFVDEISDGGVAVATTGLSGSVITISIDLDGVVSTRQEAPAPALVPVEAAVAQVPAPPAPVAPEPVPAPKAVPPRKKGRLKVWDTEKELDLAALKISGASWAVIAEKMKLTAKACKVRWQTIKDRADVRALAAAQDVAAPAVSVAAPVVAPEVPPETVCAGDDVPAQVPSHRGSDGYPKWVQAMVGADYEIATYLFNLPEDVWFPPASDLVLATSLARGDGAGAAADELGLEKATVLRRWKALNTNPTSIDHQTRLLRILRVRADTACMPA